MEGKMFKLLESFIAVYETRNFSKAAEELFLSQPTISVHINQLEKQLDTSLFERNGRTEIRPTENAKRFYPEALKIISNWQRAKEKIADHKMPKSRLKIAASHTTATTLLPKVIKFLSASIDQLQIQVSLHNSDDILEMISQHKINLGLIEKPSTNDAVKRYELMNDQLVLAGNQKSSIWLIRENGSGVYHYTQQYLKENGIIPEQTIRIKSNEIIVATLAKGIGKSIVSKKTLITGTPFKELGDSFNRSFYLLTPQHEPNKKITSLINKLVKEIIT
ncbi:LysR family transcriptional regulator [Oenococcus oeni]|uniref:LysR family transcriptional regulator n=2 Tax=Oenococcus oeni TaxID=1247 RepID=UPI00067B9B43|nr:transcriptional regulator [Oenococcus oeni]OIK80011.1 transcriptional regulator [Oenococcus oeni]OIL87187.1 transcriptional regulator [Oenococcus oeni]OIL89822.1 transcriptional regulator [Oenococcus oeni]OIM70241.1 transcriptional regulator [Oenococcus oeni]